LIGTDYWSGLIDWLSDTVVDVGNIGDKDLGLLQLTDDVDQAVAIMVDAAQAGPEPGAGRKLEPKRPD
jgi:hypothetical protein